MSKQRRLRANLKAMAVGLLAIAAASVFVPSAHAAEPVNDDWSQDCGTFTETGQTICVAPGGDLHAEVLRVTGVRIVDATTEDVPRSSVAASFLVVRFFDNLNYAGTTWEYYSTTACTSSGGVKNSYNTMFIGGDDRVSSFQGFSNCRIELYENTNFGGAVLPYASARSYVGAAFNDRTSSFRARF